jgi:putative membrane protein
MPSNIVVGLVAVIHLYIVVLEMVLWDKPAGRRAFGTSADFAQQTKVLAANQGLYNGFLAAGLIVGLILHSPLFEIFFLACVVIAGLFGGLTASRKILYIQALPAAVGLLLMAAGI